MSFNLGFEKAKTMPIENYIAFVIATIIMLLIPGPSVIMAVGQAVTHGKKAVWPTATGVVTGDFVAMTLSMLGVGTVLLASSTAFSIIKWIGIVYLMYLGIKMLLSRGTDSFANGTSDAPLKAASKMYRDAFIVTLFNPKGIVFFIAFVPQFISPDDSFFWQSAICIVTFLTLALANIWLYASFAAKARENFQNPNITKWADRTGGSLLIGAGVFSAVRT